MSFRSVLTSTSSILNLLKIQLYKSLRGLEITTLFCTYSKGVMVSKVRLSKGNSNRALDREKTRGKDNHKPALTGGTFSSFWTLVRASQWLLSFGMVFRASWRAVRLYNPQLFTQSPKIKIYTFKLNSLSITSSFSSRRSCFKISTSKNESTSQHFDALAELFALSIVSWSSSDVIATSEGLALVLCESGPIVATFKPSYMNNNTNKCLTCVSGSIEVWKAGGSLDASRFLRRFFPRRLIHSSSTSSSSDFFSSGLGTSSLSFGFFFRAFWDEGVDDLDTPGFVSRCVGDLVFGEAFSSKLATRVGTRWMRMMGGSWSEELPCHDSVS